MKKGEKNGIKKEYLDFIMDQLSELSGVTYRPMMGEYMLYCFEKEFGKSIPLSETEMKKQLDSA